MEDSVWTGTLESFREKAGGTDPVPAGVAISAASASLALALVAKVLAITGRKKIFGGDRNRLGELLESARTESAALKELADTDIAVFNRYRECLRAGGDTTAATQDAIEVPMRAARAAVRGLGVCEEAAPMIQGLMAADIGAAASLLSGAVRAMLISVDFNVREMKGEARFSQESRRLEAEARRRGDAVSTQLEQFRI